MNLSVILARIEATDKLIFRLIHKLEALDKRVEELERAPYQACLHEFDGPHICPVRGYPIMRCKICKKEK